MSYQINLGDLGAFLIFLAAVCIARNELLKNMFVRLFWSVQKPFKKGDLVEIAGTSGKIIQMGWQGVSLESAVGDYVLIPNLQIWKNPIIRKQAPSGSHGVEIRLPLFGESDGAAARLAAIESLLLSPYLALDRPYDVGLEFLPSGNVGVRVRASVFDASQKERFESSIIENYQLLMR